jgi:hypothetical protein
VVDDLGSIRIGIQDPVKTSVPHESFGPVSHIPSVPVEYLGNKRFWLHFTPL